ncbi:MAG: radical SAM protein [Desulfobacteraceae bacterium]|nr:radical SAM protein [Desulfobacteraceae bacterium]
MIEPVLSETESICPDCLTVIPARRVARGDRIYLRKTCPEHGTFESVIWRGPPAFSSWVRPKIPSHPAVPSTPVGKGCPHDCGLCAEHRQHTCTALVEVTLRCDGLCNFCFADTGRVTAADPDPETLGKQFDRLLASSGPCNVQLSGGEPTLRDDLPEIVRLAGSRGFPFIQVNTNGLRLAGDPSYVASLADAGLDSVFLQFDGMTDDVYRKLRGREMLREKIRAIDNCAAHGVGVILVATLVPGINTDQIGAMIEFAVREIPAVRGVHFQPVSYFGRYPRKPDDADRFTIPETITEIEKQTAGKIGGKHLKPPGCENSWCSFHGNFFLQADGELKPLTPERVETCGCAPISAAEGAARSRRFVSRFWAAPEENGPASARSGPSLGPWDEFLSRARTHSLSISGMAFQDAWTLDLERLKDCCIHVALADGRLIPFCAHYITDSSGRSLYRNARAGASA